MTKTSSKENSKKISKQRWLQRVFPANYIHGESPYSSIKKRTLTRVNYTVIVQYLLKCFERKKSWKVSKFIRLLFLVYAEVLYESSNHCAVLFIRGSFYPAIVFLLAWRVEYKLVNDNTTHFASWIKLTSWYLENIDSETSWLSV